MSWSRKAVTGKFDRLYYVKTEKNCDGTICRFNVLEQKSRDRAVRRLYYVETEKL